MTMLDTLVANKQYIIDSYRQDPNCARLGREFGCSGGLIWCFLDDYNVLNKIENRKYVKDYENIILDLFNQGKSAYYISNQISVNKKSVLRFLKSKGLSTSVKSKSRAKGDMVFDHKDRILNLYLEERKSTSEIAKIIGCGQSSVFRLLDSLNVELRDRAIYSLDEKFFQQIDTPNKAYILGWWYSDGCVDNAGKFRIQIVKNDSYILDKIKDIIEYTGPIYDVERKNERSQPMRCLCVNRKIVADDLIKLGCMPNKSLILDFPTFDQVPEHLMSHFLRGVFDGDGSINKHAGINITSSDIFCEKMNVYLKEKLGIKESRTRYRRPNKPTVQYYLKQDDSKKFLDFIYEDAEFYLERKYKKYADFWGIKGYENTKK